MRGVPQALAEQVDHQSGIVARAQLLAAGMTPAQARQQVRTGRWRQVHPGVYATFTGQLGPQALAWAAVLSAGGTAALSHATALWQAGALTEPPAVMQVSVPAGRRVQTRPGVRIFRRRDHARLLHPAASPPRVRVEVACLDLAEQADRVDAALAPLLAAVQKRLTTVQRLRVELERRSRHRWRGVLLDVLADAEDGAVTPLEVRYLRQVERAHRLPVATRNAAEPVGARTGYRDVRYRRYRTLVELDGRLGHEDRFRDMRRDNASTVAGEATLRFGWHDVAGRPCLVARQVAAVLTARGWTGRFYRCPACPVCLDGS